ncbi:hypothetical protein JY651_17210 [Pyxidicoccus parkwayensis]|uniref:Uncharacterized protein n=1 Tax=Pyxidicoccus parkwayensis TaxID=2813578 RepID=A0ABX7P7U5_9BACT|nr:kelch motif-containing protein [Pyxidicoccus parkwaysis]QSQ26560.1 hypothetical protein JY651_17210 [Pyxidicoccus parkwaysis]
MAALLAAVMTVACGQSGAPAPEASAQASQKSAVVTASPLHNRTGATLTLLANGKVLLAGGTTDGAPRYFRSSELYTPGASSPWAETGPLVTARYDHAATLLQNGKVLVSGGLMDDGDSTRSELYDPGTGLWSSTGALNVPRARHTQTLLPNGKVLVVGGDNPSTTRGLASAELYDPATGLWTLAAAPAFTYSGHTATLLKQGTVLVLGNRNQGELYNPATNTWSTVATSPTTVAAGHSATLLSQTAEGRVLVVTPTWTNDVAAQVDWRYIPTTNSWSASPNQTSPVRVGHKALELANGTVLVLGGVNPTTGAPISEVRRFNPSLNNWTPVPSLAFARRDFQAVLLSNSPDQVLVVGGWGKDSSGAWVRQPAELYSTGCVPQTCSEVGAQCGAPFDECGGVLDCGNCGANATCEGDYTCSPTCTPPSNTCVGQCGCIVDACGNTVDCGTCTPSCPLGEIPCCGSCMTRTECNQTACATAPQLIPNSSALCF